MATFTYSKVPNVGIIHFIAFNLACLYAIFSKV